ncbi:sensor histidine kinase [Caldimonas brevitalea]|uniref:histidine kinase n=1 Tax=Caldimonas brevitalea TaxID=413882 RepID=A0A0G3BQW1_9BURK|nr:ATP-binding protein [Caldimonas brevitalea]AKJ31807.1 two-component system, OmpR family, osmolarity sensor histidine kinase EnvZ [Caldimonas brevitalea]
MRRRFDSLFTRLLLAQALFAVVLFTSFGAVYVRDRNAMLASVAAQQWAPPLAAAAAAQPLPTGDALPVERRAAVPDDAVRPRVLAPRLRTFRRELQARGVAVGSIAFSGDGSAQRLWLQVDPGHGVAPVWLGIDAPFLTPGDSQRVWLGLGLTGLLVVGLAWALARWLTRPLARLHRRIRRGEPAGSARPAGWRVTREIAEIEHAYDVLLARLAQQQRERSLLLAGVSHDLRSPLSRIRLAAELLPEDEAHARRRDTIIANVAAADRLIESFLDLVRTEQSATREAVDLAALARRVVAGFEREEAELRVDAPPVLELTQADPHLLERALFNLVDNALKHGRAPVRLRVSANAHEGVIEVRDAGPGIAPDQREHLLQAFSRGDASRAQPGFGLGLAVVQQVAARLGGRVDMAGGPGDWRVSMRLPLDDRGALPG